MNDMVLQALGLILTGVISGGSFALVLIKRLTTIETSVGHVAKQQAAMLTKQDDLHELVIGHSVDIAVLKNEAKHAEKARE